MKSAPAFRPAEAGKSALCNLWHRVSTARLVAWASICADEAGAAAMSETQRSQFLAAYLEDLRNEDITGRASL